MNRYYKQNYRLLFLEVLYMGKIYKCGVLRCAVERYNLFYCCYRKSTVQYVSCWVSWILKTAIDKELWLQGLLSSHTSTDARKLLLYYERLLNGTATIR